MNMGPDTNVDTPITLPLQRAGSHLAPRDDLEPITRSAHTDTRSERVCCRRWPVGPPRRCVPRIPRDTANLDPVQALLRALSATSEASADAVTARARWTPCATVGPCGPAGWWGSGAWAPAYDGDYYVKEVTHRIKRGEYKQSFTLPAGGLGATSSRVTM